MKIMVYRILALTIIISGICPIAMIKEAAAEVNIQVNLGPPVIMMDEPAEVVFMPDYGIYFVPGLAYDIFFYNGFWWSSRGRHWYRSRYYRSGWTISMDRDVPGQLLRVPGNYRKRFGQVKHIPYRAWKGRPSKPRNVNGNERRNTGQAGNRVNAQPNGNIIDRGRDKGDADKQNNGIGNAGQNMGRGGDRGGGQQHENMGEGGRGR